MAKSFTLSRDELRKYASISEEEVRRRMRPTSDFMSDVIDRYINGTHHTGIKLPFKSFDSLFRLRPGELTVLAGINGAGKSLLASSIMLHAVDQGYNCASISLEMSPESQVARMVRQASLQKRPSMDACLSFLNATNEHMVFCDQYGSIGTKDLLAVIKFAKEHYKVDFVLVDSLMTMAMSSDDYNGQKDVVSALCNLARRFDIHVMLVTHARKGQSIKDRLDKWSVAGSADITNRADNVIILGRLYDMDGADAYLSVAKARHFDGAEMDIDLKFDMDSLSYWQGDDWPQQMFMQDAIKPDSSPVGVLEQAGLNDGSDQGLRAV